MEESEGFEPSVLLSTPDFESGTFGLSVSSPALLHRSIGNPCNLFFAFLTQALKKHTEDFPCFFF